MSETRVRPEDDVEEVDALPVLAGEDASVAEAPGGAELAVRSRAQVAAQVAAVAVTGFAAGAVVTAVARHARAGRSARRPRRELARGITIESTQTYLVDIHLLGGPSR